MQYDTGMKFANKRKLSFVATAIVCSAVLFSFGIEYGIREGKHTSATPNTGPLMSRINVIEPKFGHAPVRAATVETCKSVLRSLPKKIYTLLEDGGATINIAPNIEDNWPGSGDDPRPGVYDLTMGEESGRCYDRAVWLYESKKVRGSHKLKTPRSQEFMRSALYQLLGHAINDSMGVVTNKAELAKLYNEDLAHMPLLAKFQYVEEREKTADARALGCSEIIGVLISGEDDHVVPVQKAFPRTTAYLKKELALD